MEMTYSWQIVEADLDPCDIEDGALGDDSSQLPVTKSITLDGAGLLNPFLDIIFKTVLGFFYCFSAIKDNFYKHHHF